MNKYSYTKTFENADSEECKKIIQQYASLIDRFFLITGNLILKNENNTYREPFIIDDSKIVDDICVDSYIDRYKKKSSSLLVEAAILSDTKSIETGMSNIQQLQNDIETFSSMFKKLPMKHPLKKLPKDTKELNPFYEIHMLNRELDKLIIIQQEKIKKIKQYAELEENNTSKSIEIIQKELEYDIQTITADIGSQTNEIQKLKDRTEEIKNILNGNGNIKNALIEKIFPEALEGLESDESIQFLHSELKDYERAIEIKYKALFKKQDQLAKMQNELKRIEFIYSDNDNLASVFSKNQSNEDDGKAGEGIQDSKEKHNTNYQDEVDKRLSLCFPVMHEHFNELKQYFITYYLLGEGSQCKRKKYRPDKMPRYVLATIAKQYFTKNHNYDIWDALNFIFPPNEGKKKFGSDGEHGKTIPGKWMKILSPILPNLKEKL